MSRKYSLIKTIYKEDISADSIDNVCLEVSALIHLSLFNSYDTGILSLNAIGMGRNIDIIKIDSGNSKHMDVLNRSVNIFSLVRKGIEELAMSKPASVTFSVLSNNNSYGYEINELDRVAENDYDVPPIEIPAKKVLSFCRRWNNPANNTFVISFGVLSKITLNKDEFILLIGHSQEMFKSGNNIFENSTFSKPLNALFELYESVT